MPAKDSRFRFLLESAHIRGVLVHLDDVWREVLSRADYPPGVRHLLGHAMVAMPLLAATVKFGGRTTLQAKGSGPVTLLVVQANADGAQRGMAHWHSDAPTTPLAALLGDATLAIQIESGAKGDIYQGVVDAVGDGLQDAIAGYFQNSEQLSTRLWLACDGQRAAGMLLQQLPSSELAGVDQEQVADDWQRVNYLADTLTETELLSSPAQQLLGRLFNQDLVRLFDAEELRFQCGCSRQRTAALIVSLGRSEADSIVAEQGRIEVICEFCNATEHFDAVDVAAIFHTTGITGGPGTLQ